MALFSSFELDLRPRLSFSFVHNLIKKMVQFDHTITGSMSSSGPFVLCLLIQDKTV